MQVAKAGSGPISTGAAVLGGDLLFVASAASDSLLLHSPTPAAQVQHRLTVNQPVARHCVVDSHRLLSMDPFVSLARNPKPSPDLTLT